MDNIVITDMDKCVYQPTGYIEPGEIEYKRAIDFECNNESSEQIK